jgi:hypothetical protein
VTTGESVMKGLGTIRIGGEELEMNDRTATGMEG